MNGTDKKENTSEIVTESNISKENDSEIGGISQVKQNYLDKRKKLRKRASVFQIKPPLINFNIHGKMLDIF